jgi:transposase
VVNLTGAERESLEQLVRLERVSGRKRVRASILLRADGGLTDEEIADELEVGLRTVERVWQRCCERGLSACLERKPQEMSLLSRECLDQRIGTMARLQSMIAGWKASRPNAKVGWRFTTADARIKLRRLYPSIS